VSFGDWLMSLEPCWLTDRQTEAGSALTRGIKARV
jgi:hypothetical protein